MDAELFEDSRGAGVVGLGQMVRSRSDDRHRIGAGARTDDVSGHRVRRHDEVRGSAQGPLERRLVPPAPVPGKSSGRCRQATSWIVITTAASDAGGADSDRPWTRS